VFRTRPKLCVIAVTCHINRKLRVYKYKHDLGYHTTRKMRVEIRVCELKITRKLVNSHTDARSSWRAATDKLQPLLNAAARLIVSDMRKLMWPVSDIFVQPGVITSLCLDTVSARMGVRDSLLPAQLPGTH